MALPETLLFYLVVGLAVAAALMISHGRKRALQAVAAVFFWPLFLPGLLAWPATSDNRDDGPLASKPTADAPNDEFARGIAQVDDELTAALESLDGWAEGAIARERGRIDELRTAWRAQAQRIRDMDRVLSSAGAEATVPIEPSDPSTRAAQSVRARQENLARLRRVRDRSAADLAATLASVRELVSLIQLARFTGAPASRADELVSQIAAAVEGLSEVAAWNESSAA